jgi:nucleoside-diphosphate-sugar epimerase
MQLACVTGGTGFIGRTLVKRLLELGYQVRVLTRAPLKWPHQGAQLFQGDLRDVECDLKTFLDGAILLFHCAAELRHKDSYNTVNIAGTQRLIEAATGRIKRWIQLSSVGVYGPDLNGLITRNTPESPFSLYEKSKTKSDCLVREAGKAGFFEFVILRPSNVIGVGMSSNYVRKLCWMISRGYFVYLGSSGVSVNFIHVHDVVEAFITCATHNQARGQTYILSDYEVLENVVESIADELGCPSPRLRLPKQLGSGLAWLLMRVPRVPSLVPGIHALNCRSRYDSSSISTELGFVLTKEILVEIRILTKAWKLQTTN